MNLLLPLMTKLSIMDKPNCVSLVLVLLSFISYGQAKLRRLPITINHPAINVSSPFISLDGNTLVFVSDNSDENQLTMFYTTKKDAVNWRDPVMLPKTVNNRLNFLRGFALSPNGKTLYLSSLKSGGLGGFDILVSPLRGTIWAEPTNIGLPINTSGHEACPSLTADESTMYFMRCEKMDQNSATDCKILVSTKSRLGKWEEPVELPAYINSGNSQTPRILGDGETLIFSSDQIKPNKGGMDLYMTRLVETKWSNPVPLSFANTPKNDQYVSASSLGRYLLKDQPGARASEIVEMLFPPNLKPKATVMIEGKISGLENLSSPYLAAFNQENQERVYNGRPNKDGTFKFYLKEGAVYDFSVEPERDQYTFYSKTYDFTGERVPMFDYNDIEIKPISKGTSIDLSIEFEDYTSEIKSTSTQELRRVSRMIKGNADRKFQLDVTLIGYLTDSVQSSPDLTELIIDSLHFSVERLVPDTVKLDSILTIINNRDSLKNVSADSTLLADEDSFHVLVDSLRNNAMITIMVDSISIKKTYHNDRTASQAKKIIDHLAEQGGIANNVSYKTKAIREERLEERKTIVKLTIVE